uniref:Uncharacterized protein n=1 Tax=Nelumbo nucifera TaxID=4432 RepID=A0A822XEJ1_NELNU|nr:TPA_asm: hypothetical protein HUJ06_020070 [Nelumbo nucifera]
MLREKERGRAEGFERNGRAKKGSRKEEAGEGGSRSLVISFEKPRATELRRRKRKLQKGGAKEGEGGSLREKEESGGSRQNPRSLSYYWCYHLSSGSFNLRC